MLPLYIYYFASATGKEFFSFLAENNNNNKKMPPPVTAVSNHQVQSTCRTLSSCYKIGFCFTNNQASVLGLWVRLLQWGYGKPVCFSSHDKPRFPVLGYFLISHHFQYSILAWSSLELCPIQSWTFWNLKILDQTVDRKQS